MLDLGSSCSLPSRLVLFRLSCLSLWHRVLVPFSLLSVLFPPFRISPPFCVLFSPLRSFFSHSLPPSPVLEVKLFGMKKKTNKYFLSSVAFVRERSACWRGNFSHLLSFSQSRRKGGRANVDGGGIFMYRVPVLFKVSGKIFGWVWIWM